MDGRTDGRTEESGDRRTGERTSQWKHEHISEKERTDAA